MTALSIRSLSKAFGGVHAVREVSFDIKPGEFLAMIGPNACITGCICMRLMLRWRGSVQLQKIVSAISSGVIGCSPS